MNIPDIVKDNITRIKVKYINFDNQSKEGYIICNKNVSQDLVHIFQELFSMKFPIYQITPIEEFNNDDMESVKANNTSCFNFRYVIGSNKLSDHSAGNAIDINPMQNPWIHPSAHKIEGRKYEKQQKGTISNEVVNIFKKYGWNWGGDWKNPDYQHFFKPDNDLKQKIISANESKILNFNSFFKYFESDESESLFLKIIDGSYSKNGTEYPDAIYWYDKNGKFLFAYESDKWCRVSYTNLCEPFYNEYKKEYLVFIKEMIEKHFNIKITNPKWNSGPEN